MTWRILGYTLAGLGFYLLFLVTTLPAHWLGTALTRATQGSVTLRNSHGTAWRGNGLLDLRGSSATLSSQAQWELQWLPLLSGKLGIAIETRGDLVLRSDLRLGLHSLALRNTEWELPAAQLPVFFAPAMFISPTGSLRGKTEEFVIDAGQVRGEMQIRWVEAGSKVGAFSDLGDYLLVVHGENETARLRVETLRGDLKINAQGSWQAGGDGQLAVQGQINTGARDAALKPLTTLLKAQRQGEDYLLSGSGRMLLPAWLAAGSANK